MGGSAAAAVLYAGAYPDRVSHLILHFPVSFGGRSETFFDALEPLVDFDFHIHSQVMARLILGWDSPDATSYAQLRERSNTPEAAHLASKMSPRDFADFSPDVKAPTLILYKSVSQEAEQRATRAAALLAGAHLIAVPGEWIHIYPNSLGLEAILDFINTRPDAASHSAPALDVTAFRTILFTDLEAHTAMMHRLGDAKGREVLREHERISREALRAHGGTEVKTIGDSFMASFPSAQKALACAIDLQRAFASGDFAGERLRIRVGINAGEPIAEEDDLFGSSVILASRTKEKAAGGEIFVTDVVRQLVAGKGFAFTDRGEMEMKGFEEPVRLYEVRWQEGGRP
jgi:class 3 adenylate cyclase